MHEFNAPKFHIFPIQRIPEIHACFEVKQVDDGGVDDSKKKKHVDDFSPTHPIKIDSSWWLNHPFEKYATVKLDHLPQFSG